MIWPRSCQESHSSNCLCFSYFSLSSSDCSMSARMISVFLSGGSVILKMTAETALMSLLNVVSIS